jgi:hypothetical protein
MNCQSCNTEIDYRFLSNCTVCGCAVEPTEGSQPELLPQFQPFEPVRRRLTWTGRLVNLGYLLVSSAAGLMIGSVVILFGGVLTIKAVGVSMGCGTGSMVGFLLLVVGAFLGTIGGSAFAVKRPLCKTPAH